MNRETLYDLRALLALYPYYQTARLLMLQNLYLLHDPSFDEELRRAAIYISDRKVIFQMVEAAHYQLKSQNSNRSEAAGGKPKRPHQQSHRPLPPLHPNRSRGKGEGTGREAQANSSRCRRRLRGLSDGDGNGYRARAAIKNHRPYRRLHRRRRIQAPQG